MSTEQININYWDEKSLFSDQRTKIIAPSKKT